MFSDRYGTSLPQLGSITDHSVCFDLDNQTRVDQGRNFDHSRSGTDVTEHLAMHPPHGFPLRDVGHVYPRPHYIRKATHQQIQAPCGCG